MSVVQEIKERVDVLDIVGQSVQLRRSGSSYTGFCPFHDNKNTPAFVLWPDTGYWKCFGACNDNGDIFSFLMKKEGWDFKETLQYLAKVTGVVLQEYTPEQKKKTEEKDRLREALEKTVGYFQHLFQKSSHAANARAYVEKRGLAPTTVDAFEIGFSLKSWDALITYLADFGYTPDDLVEVGLATKNPESGRIYDRFRNRLMIPIRDERGRMVGFGARAIDPDDEPKYLNSPQNALFDKGRTLYGLDKARKPIRVDGTAVLVEGYLDVISAHQAGFENVICSMGTALTDQQMGQVKRYARRLVMALDADAAGQKATLKGVEVARKTGEREVAFDPIGLVRTDGQLKLDIRIAPLPDGLDPDDLIQQDPGAWKTLIGDAQSVVDYMIGELTKGRNLDDPKVKSEIADAIMPLINDVAHPIEQGTYRQRLASVLRIDERVLFPEGKAPAKRPTRRKQKQPVQAPILPIAPQEPQRNTSTAAQRYCLAYLLMEPESLPKINRRLRELKLAPLVVEDFGDTELQLLLKLVQSSLQQDEALPGDYVQDHLDSFLVMRYQTLVEELEDMNLQSEMRLRDLSDTVLRIRQDNVTSWLTELRFLQQDSQSDASDIGSVYQTEIMAQILALSRIQKALSKQAWKAKKKSHI